MVVTCISCGPVNVSDPTTVKAYAAIVESFKVGNAPVMAITCPLCHDEVRVKDVAP